ncbi:hypothetical protein DU500_03675 [Haloplanus rubicundus]|uniref:DUF7827 domain-containing protein n=1 Tax=Haloplanus rubicundus TaxID=1547898 RepID=A0A345E085_9EURY|nr:hypothetical protein [Haloplanus rubicundus]AXG05607.1 hypothetical protein DU500_03675 [Haloplanus rubicundus]
MRGDGSRFVVYVALFVLVIGQVSGAGVTVVRGESGAATVSDGGTYFVGQALSTDRYDSGDSVDLERTNGSLVTAVRVADDGTVTLDTGRFSSGGYELTSPSGPTISFDLVRQTYSVDPNRSTVSTADATLDIAVRSNRGNYTHAVRSPDFDGSTLRTFFGGAGTVASDGDTLLLSGGARQSLSMNLTGVEPGRYRFVFAVADADASEHITVSVDDSGPGQITLVPRIVQTEVGDVATVTLRFQGTDTARLTVGSAALNWRVALTVRDADGDGSVAIRVDTANARQPGTVFTATGADTASNVTVTHGTQFTDPDRRIAANPYPLSVATGGRETDVGTLSLRPATGVTSICNRNAGSLVDAYDDNADAVPGFLAGTVTETTIHGIVTDAGQRDYTIITDSDRSVSAFRAGSPDNATVEVETDCATVRTIADAENKRDAVGTAYDDGDIAIRGVGPIDTILVEVLKLGVRIGDLFGLV